MQRRTGGRIGGGGGAAACTRTPGSPRPRRSATRWWPGWWRRSSRPPTRSGGADGRLHEGPLPFLGIGSGPRRASPRPPLPACRRRTRPTWPPSPRRAGPSMPGSTSTPAPIRRCAGCGCAPVVPGGGRAADRREGLVGHRRRAGRPGRPAGRGDAGAAGRHGPVARVGRSLAGPLGDPAPAVLEGAHRRRLALRRVPGAPADSTSSCAKAVGWALRQYSKTDEAAVRTFVAEHAELSGLSRRGAGGSTAAPPAAVGEGRRREPEARDRGPGLRGPNARGGPATQDQEQET